jgi:Flp pilus assembly protein TadG
MDTGVAVHSEAAAAASARLRAFWRRLQRLLRGFVRQGKGDVTILFALALLPMVALVGAAVDYSHANLIKAAMQGAADATALAMSKSAGTLSSSQLQTSADGYFRAIFTRTDVKSLSTSTTYTTSGGTSLTVTASAQMPTTFMGIMGFKSLAINVTGTAA